MMNKTIIHAPTSDLSKSKDFYSKLKFEQVSEDDPTILTDGKALIEINKDRYARAGLKMFAEDWTETVSTLEKLTAVTETETGFVASDPNGVKLYLETGVLEIDYETKEECFGLTGNFAGLSIEAFDIEKTAEFWSAAGFKHKEGDLAQGWATFSNGSNIDLSLMKPLMCPHLFFNPGLTYFNSGKNLTIIGLMREAGIEFAEEITHFNKDRVVDNVILQDPGGLGFFIFND